MSILEPGNYLGGTQILNPERIKELTEKLWSGVDDRTRKYYPRDVFEKRVQELTGSHKTIFQPPSTSNKRTGEMET